MSEGILRVQSFASRLSAPVPLVEITVTGEGVNARFFTDDEGNAPELTLPAPDRSYSLQPDPAVTPYALYTVSAAKEGWQPLSLTNVQIFDGQTTLAQLELLPANAGPALEPGVPDPADAAGGSGPAPESCGDETDAVEEGGELVLDRVVIPTYITVHLGKPAVSAQNVTVTFRHYIANVASSEVYPTWPEQALRANILAQISLALNRVYTEWYPSRGYTFNITNSTSYDQYFVYKRTVFAVMERLTDELFATYIRKRGTVNPYYAEYCDGRTVTCSGMKQWGTVDRANAGESALQILRYYYGSDVELATSNNIQSIPQSYPGSALRVGSTGTNVAILQRWLNRITQDYPSFGKLTVDSVFGSAMEATVKKFQRQFSLTADGVVGRSTWYKISYIYVSVKRLAQLTSEGETDSGAVSGGSWGGVNLQVGSTGSAVEQVQFWLNALSQFDSAIPAVSVDGQFGAGTRAAVLAFQREEGLSADGVVGRATWNALYEAYVSLQNDLEGGVAVYPGTALRRGDSGNNVKLIQFWLRIAADEYSVLPAVTVDGSFGTATERAVRAFQEYFGLSADGVVGRSTWEKLNSVYLAIVNSLLAPGLRPGEYPGVLRQGSSGNAVRELQYYLYLLAAYYPTLPAVSIDGVFGTATKAAVTAWQTRAGLTADGVVGTATWNSLVQAVNSLTGSGAVVRVDVRGFGGAVLAEGHSGSEVEYLKQALRLIAYWKPSVQSPGEGDFYDETLADSVVSFQREQGLPATGEADEATWAALNRVYLSLNADAPQPPPQETDGSGYPGYGLALDSVGAPVRQVQLWLNALARRYCSQQFVPEDGVYGEETRRAVEDFQRFAGLPATGTVDLDTWDLLKVYASASDADSPDSDAG